MGFRRLAAMLLGVVAITLPSGACADPAPSAPPNPPIWRVTDADTEMVLFGSMHDLPADLDWKSAPLTQALDQAELVVFESLADNSPQSQAIWRAFQALMTAPTPLNTAIPDELYQRARQIGIASGMQADDLDTLRPWAAAMALDQATVPVAQGDQDDLALAGADMVIETGLKPNQRRAALDTPALLATAFAPMADAAANEGQGLLVELLDELPRRALDHSVQQAWAVGDTAPMVAELDRLKADAPVLYQAMFDARNRAWLPALTRMMQTESRVVVVVGAGHMIGDAGLPTLLRQAGFTVETLQAAP